MALTETDATRLAVLEAIEFESPTTNWLELHVKDTLPAVGGVVADQVDRGFVQRALAALEREGLAFAHWAANDLDEHRRPSAHAERLWTITAAGAAELAALRELAHGD